MQRAPAMIPVLPGPVADPSLPHVVLLLDGFPRSLGGGERIALRLAALLPGYGYRVSIVTFSMHPESPVLREPAPCPIFLLRLTKTYDLNAVRAAWLLGRFLRTEKVRIVQTFFESSDLWGGLVVKLFSRAHLVWSRRDMGILRAAKHRLAYRWMRRAPARVLAVSEQVRRFTLEVDGVAPERVHTVYNGLDLPHFPTTKATLKTTSELFKIVTVGNIRRVKGHDILIRAAAQIVARYPGASVYLAGEVLEPEYFLELQALVEELKLRHHIHFVGGLADLRPFFAEADLFVLPSRSEGFSNAILEAMAAGLPVVATDVGGNAEAVADGRTGTIVAADNAPALAAAMLALLSDPERLRRLGETGRQRVVKHFTTEAMMSRVAEIFGALLAQRP